jgi:serine/threonine-protein phosphatase 2A activator
MLPICKHVKTDADMAHFRSSCAYKLIVSYIEKLCLSVKGDLGNESSTPEILRCLKVLDTIEKKVHQIEPLDQPMRFGNIAFRNFHEWLTTACDDLLFDFCDLRDELKPYLLDSFGNPIRIDYGTGHEAAFFMFLIILIENEMLTLSPPVVLLLFRKYILLVRLITTKYNMEPAGSHGVWGLDDYHHLPFIFGAAQLIGHESLVKPSQLFDRVDDPDLSNSLYASMIGFIKTTKCKHARFHEVSPLLFDFTRFDSWAQVCIGLLRMYTTEVLGKRPIVQHFFFGNVVRWEE